MVVMKLPKNSLRISITTACNMKCVYCHKEGNLNRGNLSVDQLEMIIKSAMPYGLKTVRITGGDPLVSNDIIPICRLLKEKFNVNIEINTNGIEIEKLLYLINQGWISRVVVGMDYYDAPISKNSPCGKSSNEIKNNILKIQNAGCTVEVDTVYDGDYANISNLVKWCMQHKIRIKILEIVDGTIAQGETQEYHDMMLQILQDFSLERRIDSIDEIHGYKDGFRSVSFFHSLCRLEKCEFCQKNQLRISSYGEIKTCILNDKYDVSLLLGDINENFEKGLSIASTFMNRK